MRHQGDGAPEHGDQKRNPRHMCTIISIKAHYMNRIQSVSIMHLPFKFPFSVLVAGPSGSGKTMFTLNMLRNLREMSDKPIEEVIFCYGISQALHQEIPKICPVPVRFHEGLPDFEAEFKMGGPRRLIIIDDLYRELNGSVVDLYTRTGHHRDLSCWTISQNLYGKGLRDISLNAQYIIIFTTPRDRSQVKYFSRQVDPARAKMLEEAFQNATSVGHGYLLYDLTQGTPDYLRYRTNIFPPNYTELYMPKSTVV